MTNNTNEFKQISIFHNPGWQCPICGCIYSPSTPECYRCNKKEYNIMKGDINDVSDRRG